MTTLTSQNTNISNKNGSISVVLDDGSWSSLLEQTASSAISSVEYKDGIMEVTFHRVNSISDSEVYSFTATETASTQMYDEISNVLSSGVGSVGTVYNSLLQSEDLTKLN